MKYILKWKGETVDETTSKRDALYLLREYNIAYGGGVTCKKLESNH